MKYSKLSASEPSAQLLRRVKLEMSEVIGSPVTLSDALELACRYWLAAYYAGPPGKLPPWPGGGDGSDG